jgi:hypothetical protein
VDYFWNTYGFSGNKAYRDDAWGWDDCCNTSKPLAARRDEQASEIQKIVAQLEVSKPAP